MCSLGVGGGGGGEGYEGVIAARRPLLMAKCSCAHSELIDLREDICTEVLKFGL